MGSAEDSSKEINSGGTIMTIEKELAITFECIKEHFSRLFDFIDWFEVISASEGLSESKILTIEKRTVFRMMKQWSEHFSKYFESQQQTSIAEDSKIKLPEQYDKATKDFSKRLDEFCLTTVDVYLGIVQNLIRDYTNNEKIHHNLILLEDELRKKKTQLMEFQTKINEKFPKQSSVSESNLGGTLC